MFSDLFINGRFMFFPGIISGITINCCLIVHVLVTGYWFQLFMLFTVYYVYFPSSSVAQTKISFAQKSENSRIL